MNLLNKFLVQRKITSYTWKELTMEPNDLMKSISLSHSEMSTILHNK